MVFLIIALFFLGIAVLLLFSSKQLSPIPYFPSNYRDMHLIAKTLDLQDNQIVIDLGAGDGMVIFEAARSAHKKKLNTQFVATEINPVLILIMKLRRLLHPNRSAITILKHDMFKDDIADLTSKVSNLTFYLYISPWFLDTVSQRIRETYPRSTIVSYMYPIKKLRKREKDIKGKNSIFVYT